MWESLGGLVVTGAAVASWGTDEVQVFAIRDDGQVWDRFWDGKAWHDWHPHGGSFAGQLGASARDAGRIDVFAFDSSGLLQHLQWDGERWLPWEEVRDAPSQAKAVACCWSGGRLDLFLWDREGDLMHSEFPT